VEKTARELGYDFSGVDKPQNEHSLYGLRYAEFVVPLVKAMQEQQRIIEEQHMTNETLKKEIETLKQSNLSFSQQLIQLKAELDNLKSKSLPGSR
jgi:molecular chaperone GrpE (heat shock protein)